MDVHVKDLSFGPRLYKNSWYSALYCSHVLLWLYFCGDCTLTRAVGLHSAYGEVRLSCKNVQLTGTFRVGLETTWTVVSALKILLDFVEIEQLIKTRAVLGFRLCDVVMFTFGFSVWQLLSMSLSKQIS